MKPRLVVSLLALVALVVLAGCGSSASGSGSGGGADPAKLAPATAPLYIEATLRPDGQLGDDANAALKKLLQTNDPGSKLVGVADKALKSDGLSWNADIKPWLGQRVAVFITSFAQGKPVGALIADTTDTGKAKSSLEKLLTKSGRKTSTKTYKGIDFTYEPTKNNAVGIVDGYAVAGSWAGVQQIVDTSKGGRPLADVADFTSARSATGADQALGMAYVQPQALIDAVGSLSSSFSGARTTAGLNVLRQMMAKSGRAVTVALHANGDAVRIDAAALGTPPSTGSGSGADELAALPGDAWLAVGFGDLGTSLSRTLSQLGQLAALSGSGNALGANAGSFGALFKRFEARTGINIQKDLLSWMGSGAIYARGHGITDLGVVLTIKSKDPAKSHRAVGLIAKALAKSGTRTQSATVEGYDKAVAVRLGSIPFPLIIAAGGDRFSIGLNPQALTDVLHPSTTLGDSPQYAAAAKSLGGSLKPVFLLDTPTIVGLAESFGASNSASFAKIKKYLDALGPLSAGIEHDADTTKVALALALK